LVLCIESHLFEFQVFSIKFTRMPTILRINGFRFFFYSNENDEPAHIHIEKGDAEGKVWLEPIMEGVYFRGFTNGEQNEIMDIIKANLKNFIIKWYEHFSK